MSESRSLVILVSLWAAATALATEELDVAKAERGRTGVREIHTALARTAAHYENLWQQWGLTERPANFAATVRERYGLHFEPSAQYPLGVIEVPGIFGKSLSQNCLICHAGAIAGQTIVGLGNATLDYQGLLEDLLKGDGAPWFLPFQVSRARGTVEAVGATTYFLQFRNHDLSFREEPTDFLIRDELYEDIPAWWNLKYKRTMFHTGSTDARALRVNLSFLLSPMHSGTFIRSHEAMSSDIKLFLFSLDPPPYPFPVDEELALRGEKVFLRSCARCHGTYGDRGKYPNKVIPIDEVGTDPALVQHQQEMGKRSAEMDTFTNNWLYQEFAADGEEYHAVHRSGYQAPPLHGVWATAPYFHNGSVPTIYHVIHSRERPSIYRPTFDVSPAGYDQDRLGLTFSVLKDRPSPATPAYERRKVTDTTSPGRGNQGHTFGDGLNASQRAALLEYLKTL